MVWNSAYSVTDKNGRKLDAEADVSPTESELEAELRAKNLANLIYTGNALESSMCCHISLSELNFIRMFQHDFN